MNFTPDEFDDDASKRAFLILLGKHKMHITFEKVDKTIREMNCTLIPELLPKLPETVLNESGEVVLPKERKESTTAFKVFDIDKQEFRSIRWNSIQSFMFVD